MHSTRLLVRAAACALLIVIFGATRARAHCDRLDGPVVKAAQDALATGDAGRVLIWVTAADEAEARRAFERTRVVRALGADARELADRFFFETIVRLHRAGEGEPFTGVKPAGLDPGPAITAAERALSSGSVTPALQLVLPAVERGLRQHFADASRTKPSAGASVDAGREHVRAYVQFLHYVERLVEAAGHEPAHGHSSSAAPEAPRRR